MVRTHMVRVEHDIWKEYKKASADYDFGVGDLINWILASIREDKDIDEWAKDLDSKVEFEEDEKDKISKEAEIEDKEEAKSEDEDESEDEEEDESEEEEEAE